MELKKYQQIALETLSSYLAELKKFGPKHAFISTTGKPYNEDFFGVTPFLCVKIPTGGGKTFVGCHAIGEIMQSVLKSKLDHGIVMWFVPSEAIKTQTLRKFKDKNDSHRKILDEAFENSVRIFSNEEALSIRWEDVADNVCIVVSSLDAFRKEKTLQKKYKVYQENGALLGHFEHLADDSKLEKDDEDMVINSLANVVRISNPLIMVDEGHKTKTKLSIDFLKDLNPSFIVEYTATPRGGSNILIDIHSSELKSEEMVKIPLVLESASQWQNAVARGIDKRNELEKEAKKVKGEYIRPIALLQAQPKNASGNSVTVEELKTYLLSAKIPEDQIAIKTSEKNELEGVDLFSRKCDIRYIITVSALAEGWDCSFAYVLISVANLGAKIAVEQIIGRIIRMPYAKKKESEALNRSYIFASARNFNEAAGQIISGLEDNGYSRLDLIDANKGGNYELEVTKIVKETLSVPMMSLNGDVLSFEDLIGEDFELAKENHKFDFEIHFDNDGRAIIDIKEDDQWIRGAQQILNLTYKDKNFSKAELIQWLDKKLRFSLLEKEDKVKFIEKSIESQLNGKSLTDLSINRYLLADKLSEVINGILEHYAKNRFDKFLKGGSIDVETKENFPDSILLKQEVPQEFNKNYYGKIDKLNKEELALVERLDLDALPNIKYWARNREKLDPFYIQGWRRGKFYPDFVAVTKRGNIIALEWKGEDRVSNEDTAYKVEITNVWAKHGKGKLHFFLVHNGNVEEVLLAVKAL